jgi:hypothetical protein
MNNQQAQNCKEIVLAYVNIPLQRLWKNKNIQFIGDNWPDSNHVYPGQKPEALLTAPSRSTCISLP